jgi:hypothetical protein
MGVSYGPRITTDGLIMRIDPASLRSYPGTGSSITDVASGRVGTISGVTISDGTFDFDGVNDLIDMNNSYINQTSNTLTSGSSTGQSDYTLEAWIYVRTSQGTTTSADSIIGSTSSSGVGMQVGVSGGNPRMNFGARNTNNFYGSTFSYNQWYHVVWCKQHNTFTNVYMNGELDTGLVSFDGSDDYYILGGPYGNITIGNSSDRVTGFFDGKMGPLSIYNKGLSESEVRKNFVAHRARFGL